METTAGSRTLGRRMIDALAWDGPVVADGAGGWIVALRRPLIALVASAWLTVMEWRINRPPEIALIAVLHFVVVLLAIALVVHFFRWIARSRARPDHG
jgi:hypothetical protein